MKEYLIYKEVIKSSRWNIVSVNMSVVSMMMPPQWQQSKLDISMEKPEFLSMSQFKTPFQINFIKISLNDPASWEV